MPAKQEAKSARTYVQRLLEDEFIQEQLRNAATGGKTAYIRARDRRGQATEDKKLYGALREAATSIRNATLALQRPQPQPKRRLRKLATVALAIGATVWLTLKLQKLQSEDRIDADTRPDGGSDPAPGPVPSPTATKAQPASA